MKEFRPINTFFLTLSTIVILLVVSTFSVPEDSLWGIRSIDMFSALKPAEQPLTAEDADGSYLVSEDYSVDYVRNDIVAARELAEQQEQIEKAAKEAAHKAAQKLNTYQNTLTKKPDSSDTPAEKATTAALKPTPTKKPIPTKEQITSPTHRPKPKTAAEPKQTEEPIVASTVLEGEAGIDIENSWALNSFLDNLRSANDSKRPVRIAVLGDSFIEGDIMTQDLREMFQDKFSGEGVGFVPMASTVSAFRQTITHTFAGWTTYCISTASRRGNYTISSYTYSPGDGSVSRYTTTRKRRHIGRFSRARLMFINRGNSTINVKINNNAPQQFTPASSDRLQQITVAADSITEIEFSFRSTDSFTAYGAYLDGVSGVAVDNYSVRGNSGMSLASTSADLLTQMNSLMPVDLIILEYGLNVAQADVRSYTQYQQKMTAAINHIRQTFPNASILLMSVPDRAHRTAIGWQTMPGIRAMEKMQRQLASDCGVAFWSTMRNMQSIGGMGHFVSKGWAAKDYTHLSHKGGRVVARSLFDAIMKEYGN